MTSQRGGLPPIVPRDHLAQRTSRRRRLFPILRFIAAAAFLVALPFLLARTGENGGLAAGTEGVTTTTTGAFWTASGPGAAGDRTTGTLEVSNGGPLPFRYELLGESNSSLAGAMGLRIALRGGADCDFPYHNPGGQPADLADDVQLFAGTLSQARLLGAGAQSGDRTLLPGAGETLCFAAVLPLTAGNGLQGLTNTTRVAVSPVTDVDGDGVSDTADNCPLAPNPDQADLDGDLRGNACDLDDDNDGVVDIAETPCGGDPLNASLRPERSDLAGDDDGDTLVDEALPAIAAAYDCDGDGYTGTIEGYVFGGAGPRDQDPCGADGWPLELSTDANPPDSANRVNIRDINTFLFPRRLDANPGDASFSYRHDLLPGASFPFSKHINLADLQSLVFSLPPMFGGATRAMNGPLCPWAP